MSDAQRFFAHEWRAMARRIGRTLADRGVPACDRDDVLQETALRLYRSWDRVDETRSIEAYARAVALNVLRDNARRPVTSGEVLGDVPETADAGDVVERTTLARIELGRVRRALTLLRPTEQRVLHEAVAAEVGDASDVVVPAALRMARMRARRQLVAVLRTASGLVALVVAGVRAARGQRVLSTVGVAAVLAVTLFAPGGRAPRVVPLGPGKAGSTADRSAVGTTAPSMPARSPAREGEQARGARRPPRRAPRPAAPEPAHVDLPVGQVAVIASFDGGGVHAEVRDRGDGLPACADTPAGPLDPRVDCG